MNFPPLIVASCCASVALGCSAGLIQTSNSVDFEVQTPASPVYLLQDGVPGTESIVPIVVRNASAEPLSLSLASKTCNCIDVRIPKKRVAPGEKARIDLVAPTSAGSRRVGFTIEGTIAGLPPLQKTVEMTLSVYARQETSPRAIVRELPKSDADAFALVVRAHTLEANPRLADHRVEIRRLPPFLQIATIRPLGVRFVETGVTAMEWEVTLQCRRDSGGAAQSARHGQLEVAVDALAPLTVPYHFTGGDEVTVSPEVIYFDPTPLGQHAERYAVVQIGGENAIPIPTMKSSQPDFSVQALESLSPASPGGPRLFRVKLRFTPTRPGVHRSEITLSFDVARKTQLQIVATGRGV